MRVLVQMQVLIYSIFQLLLLGGGCHAFVSPVHSGIVVSPTTTTTSSSTTTTEILHNNNNHAVTALYATAGSSKKSNNTKKRPLVLLTFDLDDTLYPIAPVIEEANTAFAKAMEKYGYAGIKPNDIDETTKQVRAEMDPQDAAALSHTEARALAIRRQMEKALLQRKLAETAEDWVTSVNDLSPVVVENAKQWTSRAVSPSIVQAVLTAWEMERHHAAERHLYPEVQSVLKEIKEEHPNVLIGAVTDGKANPLLMTFTLAPYFDFCMSWEDDQKGRTQFFKDLASSNTAAQLTWIYNAAVEKGHELAEVQAAIKAAKQKKNGDAGSSSSSDGAGDGDDNESVPDVSFEKGVWIHVGDDLAYDVGGSAACGAKTILCELADEYKQTARQRFSDDSSTSGTIDDEVINGAAPHHSGLNKKMPAWSTSNAQELEVRQAMNEAARDKVTETINFIRELPDAIYNIVEAAQDEEGSLLQQSVVNTSER